MSEPRFRFICAPSALAGAPAGWAREMLEEGEVALLGDEGLTAVNEIAHQLAQTSIAVIRSEQDPERQDRTVIEYAQALPMVWIGARFSDRVQHWARDRGPMTLLVQSHALDEEQRRRIDRFVAILGRQSE